MQQTTVKIVHSRNQHEKPNRIQNRLRLHPSATKQHCKGKQREREKHSRILNDLNTSSFCGTKGVSLDQAPIADGMQWKLTAICNSRLFSCWLNVFWGDTINSYCLHTILHHSVLFPYGLRFLQALLPIGSLIFSNVGGCQLSIHDLQGEKWQLK